jgi:prepilin-type N-terminal cleavage/methylation domain-containing protein
MLMKRSITSAFTLIEMLTVMAVIAILASLIVAVYGFAQKKAALSRAQGEISAMGAACENYKGDFAGYPRHIAPSGKKDDSDTDDLDPRTDGDPNDKGKDGKGKTKYAKSSLYLYKCLSGDAKPGTDATRPANPDDEPDGKPETKGYCEFKPDQLDKNKEGTIKFIVDPFGNSYGYSTAGARADEEYRDEVQKNPNTPRQGEYQRGFSPGYDLWSTAGLSSKGTANLEDDRKRWVKSW